MGRKRFSAGGDHRQAARGGRASRPGQEGVGGYQGLGIGEVTYYRWRQEYGGMSVTQARRLKDLERENARLHQAVADPTLDEQILLEASKGNRSAPPVAVRR